MHPVPEWYYSDNGFPSVEEMHAAHQPIVALATAVLSSAGGNIVDLGCGNGMLLKKIHEVKPASVPFGIDVTPSRIEHARELNPQFAANFVCGDLFDCDRIWPDGRRYALVILMPGRLLEVGSGRATKLKERIRAHGDQVLAYAYDDWIARHGSLLNLAREAGLSLHSTDASMAVSLASIL
jgi:methyltransferase family protein